MTAMTTAQPHHRSGRRLYPAKDYVECPVCHTPTGTMVNLGGQVGFLIVLDLAVASGHTDGARCITHRRTEHQRLTESTAAMRWMSERMVEPTWPGDIS